MVDIKALIEGPQIFKNREVLSHRYIPDEILFRDEEIKEIVLKLRYALHGQTPPNLMILGPTGTGKTVTIMKVLKELEKLDKDNNINTIYTLASGSSYTVLTQMAKQYDPSLNLKGLSFLEAWNKFKRELERDGKITICVLDEIDKMLTYDSELLYSLSRANKISIVSISNKVGSIDGMIKDKRVVSSFNPMKILFNSYTAPQIEEILKRRIELAFHEGVIEDDVPAYIAALAAQKGGDMRYALDLLLYAGDVAEKALSSKITKDHVRKAKSKLEYDFIRNSILNMSFTHQLMLYTLVKFSGYYTQQIYDICNYFLQKLRGERHSDRWMSQVLSDLELLGFAEYYKVGIGRGRGTRWKAELNKSVDREVIERALRESSLGGYYQQLEILSRSVLPSLKNLRK